MKSPKPKVDAKLAEQWAREIYGIEATASPLPGYIDRNYLLTTSRGRRSVFKIATGDSDRTELEGQIDVLRHLEASELGGLVPRIIPDRDGRGLSEAQDADGVSYLLRRISYVEGRPLAQSGAATPELRCEIGRALGRLDSALQAFDHPGAHRQLVWDLARLLELRPLLDAVTPELRPFVETGLDRFTRNVQPRIDGLRSSVVHNDANDYNLLVAEDSRGRPRLSGLIDFGDVVHTMTVAELAIACAYGMLGEENALAAAEDFVAGYEEALPLEPLERTLLPDLIVGRLCASLLMSAKARLESPDDEYRTISERPVATLLKRLA